MPGGLGIAGVLASCCAVGGGLGEGAAAAAWAAAAARAIVAWTLASACCWVAANCCNALPMAAKASAIFFSEVANRDSMLESPSSMRRFKLLMLAACWVKAASMRVIISTKSL